MGVPVPWKDQRAAETGSQVSGQVSVWVDAPNRPLIRKGGKRSLDLIHHFLEADPRTKPTSAPHRSVANSRGYMLHHLPGSRIPMQSLPHPQHLQLLGG